MARDKALTAERNHKLIQMHNQLAKEGYSHRKILEEIQKTFFIKPRTIYAIISGEHERK